MPIRQIKLFIQSTLEGDHTIKNRVEMLLQHRQDVLRQIEELNKNLEKINHKIVYYEGRLTRYSEQNNKAIL